MVGLEVGVVMAVIWAGRGGLTEITIGVAVAVVVGVTLICDDFSTADLTISMDLSKFTSPCGGLVLFRTAVGLVLVLGLTTVLVCKTDKSTSDKGIFSSGTRFRFKLLLEDCCSR